MALNLEEEINNWLPRKETQFLRKVRKSILLKRPKNLKGKLKKVVEVLSDKKYGLRENIEEKSALRFPSEIKMQRFCREEALKNYLICQSLGIEAIYFSTENFQNRQMPHDVILVRKNGNNFFMLDWEKVSEVKLTDKGIFSQDDKLISQKVEILTPNDIIELSKLVRGQGNLIDLISSPQLLYHTRLNDGESETYARYSLEKKRLTLTQVTSTIPWALPYYYRRISDLSRETQEVSEEWGIARDRKGHQYVEIPVEIKQSGRIFGFPFLDSLEESERKAIIIGTIYYAEKDKQKKRFLLHRKGREEIHKDIQKLARRKEKGKNAHLLFYDALKKKFQRETSETYLDFLGFQVEINSDYKGNVDKALYDKTGVKNNREFERLYIRLRNHHQKSFGSLKEIKSAESSIIDLL